VVEQQYCWVRPSYSKLTRPVFACWKTLINFFTLQLFISWSKTLIASKFSHTTPILKSPHWLKINKRIRYKKFSLIFKLLYIYITQPSYLYNLISIQTPHNARSSSVVNMLVHLYLLLLKNYQSFVSLCITSSLESTPSFTYFVNHVLICLFLTHHTSMIISPRQCHHHHSYHLSPHHSLIAISKL